MGTPFSPTASFALVAPPLNRRQAAKPWGSGQSGAQPHRFPARPSAFNLAGRNIITRFGCVKERAAIQAAGRSTPGSSAWLEYFAAGENAAFFAAAIEDTQQLVVAVMQQGLPADLDARIAIRAARLGIDHRLPMANGVMLATAREHDATLWTQGAHFEGIAGVEYRKEPQ